MAKDIGYKSFCWSLGTTSFRTRNFNKTIEEQLALLDAFWRLPENQGEGWLANNALQSRYYTFMQARGFVEGAAGNQPKDAREKTSGLVCLGLIADDRRLTPAGQALLAISQGGDFSADNFLQIEKDSFLYLRQLLKTGVRLDGGWVRPLLLLLHLLAELDYLTLEEFTYLLPLCTNPWYTAQICAGVRKLRQGQTTVDEIILRRLLAMDNYQQGLALLLAEPVNEALLCQVGFNRKSRSYDKAYYPLYLALRRVFLDGETAALADVYRATKKLPLGGLWRGYLFDTCNEGALRREGAAHLRATAFDSAGDEAAFKTAFFRIMHLLKAKATLADYLDLNRRYLKTADILLFADGQVRLDVIPQAFFAACQETLYQEAYQPCPALADNCALAEINPCLLLEEGALIAGVNQALGSAAVTLAQAKELLQKDRYRRLGLLLAERFGKQQLLTLLRLLAARRDDEIRALVTDNADVPTIFEYVLGLIWYRLSGFQGRVLDYMKLSLDADLLPKTHAAGGEADIVYEYPACAAYPRHALLLEATLADSSNQRRMEMEPVSRHLGQYLLRSGDLASYCVFVTNDLNLNVVADFRSRQNTPYYDPQDPSRYVEGMKIIPLELSALERILAADKTYAQLYQDFETAFHSTLPPHLWQVISNSE